MASINKLTAKQVIGLREGLHSDGGNLYLSVRPGGSRQWVMRYRSGGRQRELGLGGAGPGAMPLAEAREKAGKVRVLLRDGIDPLEQKAAVANVIAVPTFRSEMEEYILRNTPSWKSPKSGPQWRASLETHAKRILDMKVDRITGPDVIAVLDPIWYSLPETARRVRSRIEVILSLSKMKGHRSGENPAIWRGNLNNVFKATPALVHGHFASMDYLEIPAFIRTLRCSETLSALVLEWIILTVSRAQVGVSATWGELDLAKQIWRIKAARMKGDKNASQSLDDHVVPLSPRTMALLERAGTLRITGHEDELVFPSVNMSPLSLNSLDHCRERMNVFTTTHGFRSTFRTWVAQETYHEEALAEKALAHLIGDETARAYNRGTLLEKRRVLMNDWSDFLDGVTTLERNPFVKHTGAPPAVVIEQLKVRKFG